MKRSAPLTLTVCAVLAVVILWMTGLLVVRLKPYWVAKYRGEGADLHGAVLPLAPLREARLGGAGLSRSVLWGADLREANLTSANLRGANLRNARLCRAMLQATTMDGADLCGTDMSGAYLFDPSSIRLILGRFSVTGARYNRRTRWPDRFNPTANGAVLVD